MHNFGPNLSNGGLAHNEYRIHCCASSSRTFLQQGPSPSPPWRSLLLVGLSGVGVVAHAILVPCPAFHGPSDWTSYPNPLIKALNFVLLKRKIMRNLVIITLSLLVLALPVQAQDTNSPFATEKDETSYAIGYTIGMNLKRQGFDADADMVANGIRDILEGNETALTESVARQVLQEYQQKLFKKRQDEQNAAAAVNKAEGTAWLTENSKKDGVTTLDSGLQYKVLTEGEGETAGPSDTVKVHYRGTLIDGTEFDSSHSRGAPASFRVAGVIRGWTEALQLMQAGDKWQLFVPSSLAYGDRAQGDKIKPGSTLIFEVELIEIIKPQPITSDIIKVPSAEEMKKGAKIETIKASDLKRIEAEAKAAKEAE